MVTTVLKRIDRRLLVVIGVLLLVAVTLNLFRSPAEMRTVTAHFPRAVSVYAGSDVRVLGVNVGKVTAVIPEGNSVRVEMEYDAAYKIPADAKAVIVTPTLVADRFVQTDAGVEGRRQGDGRRSRHRPAADRRPGRAWTGSTTACSPSPGRSARTASTRTAPSTTCWRQAGRPSTARARRATR
ncbi:MCE family protein [Nocardioides sp. W3-2-3]|uniref:MlaD family protein n=1 Tax=Nocardioides convexus TaxID=2712224 RepID=UPI00241859D6|nr:MlaD family protein [Nocardioides convexus]NGZ99887.1 MCE family protein [Nocardioides convexus]